MAVDVGLLERVQQLKQEHGIGSKQAWEYLRVRRPYEQMQTHVIAMIRKANLSDFTPEVGDVIEASERVRYLLKVAKCDDIAEIAKNTWLQKMNKIKRLYRQVAGHDIWPAYHRIQYMVDRNRKHLEEAGIPPKNIDGLAHAMRGLYSDLVGVYFLGFESEDRRSPEAKRIAGQSLFEVLLSSSPESLSIAHKLFDALQPSGSLDELDTQFYGSMNHMPQKLDVLSRYDRAVIEDTLPRGDMERAIALDYITVSSSNDEQPVTRINKALEHLRADTREARLALSLTSDNTGDFKVGDYLAGEIRVEDLPQSYRRELVKAPEKVIYPLMRGTATEDDIKDYLGHRSAYITRAIKDHEKWLKEQLLRRRI